MFEPLQKYLMKAAGEYQFSPQLKAIQICQEYRVVAEKILPKEALKQTFPKSYKDNILSIGVYNSAWAQQLMMHKHNILQAINEKFGNSTVKKIQITVCEPDEEIIS